MGYNEDSGQVERNIGEAIRESRIPREELFIVTKLLTGGPIWRTSHNCFHKFEDVEIDMDMSLGNFKLDYAYTVTWAAMEKL
ncbi:hypothetical protein ACJ73_00900 [Blastomyces percursus]|uniref:NADP-dependent oxidoreductase domain-containing protein n=1 Tax=Blastomyces percursus TaxID=1658174 RepID=A0A1J9QGV5_9EURO|nr:hypothetical protein ACJ73_00900 [Blastomyces percursus]